MLMQKERHLVSLNNSLYVGLPRDWLRVRHLRKGMIVTMLYGESDELKIIVKMEGSADTSPSMTKTAEQDLTDKEVSANN